MWSRQDKSSLSHDKVKRHEKTITSRSYVRHDLVTSQGEMGDHSSRVLWRHWFAFRLERILSEEHLSKTIETVVWTYSTRSIVYTYP